MSDPKVYVFWDNSNIFISAKEVAIEDDSDGSAQVNVGES